MAAVGGVGRSTAVQQQAGTAAGGGLVLYPKNDFAMPPERNDVLMSRVRSLQCSRQCCASLPQVSEEGVSYSSPTRFLPGVA